MAQQPTIMNRMQNMPQAGAPPAQNPAYPSFLSTQNAKNFFGDFLGGAEYGLQGGVAASVAQGAYNAFGGAGSTVTGSSPEVTKTLSDPGVNKFLAQIGARENAPGWLAGGTAAAQKILPQAKQLQSFIDQLKPQPNVPEAMLQKYSQKTPQAQSGPQIIAQGPGGEQKPYFSFEKHFNGSPSMRSIITNSGTGAQAAGMPQGPGEEDTQGPVPNNPNQQPMEQWGRPQGNGFWNSAKGYAYDTADWLKNSPWSQRIVGGLAGLGASYFTGGAAAPFIPGIASGAGGLFKGLMGQITNFLAERTDVPANAENPAKPSAQVQALQQPAILRAV